MLDALKFVAASLVVHNGYKFLARMQYHEKASCLKRSCAFLIFSVYSEEFWVSISFSMQAVG